VAAVVFDIGGVLVDWNPRYLYGKLLDETAMERFLAEVCTLEWHQAHDAGYPMAESSRLLAEQFPAEAHLIDAWRMRWSEMFGGPIAGTVDLLERLVAGGHPVHGLTNWPAEKFGDAVEMFPFLSLLDPVVVSGRERVTKPDRALFDILIERANLTPGTTLYIDDAPANISTALDLGFQVHTFVSPGALSDRLRNAGLV
jgi:2-haloacid dehalogenase